MVTKLKFRLFTGAALTVLLAATPSCSKDPLEQRRNGKTIRLRPEFADTLPIAPGLTLDDGPFFGAEFEGLVGELGVDERVPFRDGEILISNRTKAETPIMAFIGRNGETRWVVDLDPSMHPDFNDAKLERIFNCQVNYPDSSSVITFTSDWDYGIERGFAYFGPEDQFGCFFLSW